MSMAKKMISRLSVLAVLIVFLAACSKQTEYTNVIPADATAVASIDLKSLANKAGMNDKENEAAKQKLLEAMKSGMNAATFQQLEKVINNPGASGLDPEAPIYIFSSPQISGGAFVAKVSNEDDLHASLDVMAKEQICQPVTGIQSIDNKLYYFDANGVQQDATFGIDVSKYQSNIDWEQVKTAGVKFVIIRIGYRGYGSGALVLDPMFEQHFTNARNAGLKVGVYFFSQAVNENEAREEAQGCAYVLNGRKLDYPIYFDTEASGGKNGRADGLGVEDRTKCAVAFCEEVKAQGYQPGVYASTLWFRKRIDLNRLKSYSIWNAHYNVAGSPIACDMWQGTCTARIPGYGGQIDVNISYVG